MEGTLTWSRDTQHHIHMNYTPETYDFIKQISLQFLKILNSTEPSKMLQIIPQPEC